MLSDALSAHVLDQISVLANLCEHVTSGLRGQLPHIITTVKQTDTERLGFAAYME